MTTSQQRPTYVVETEMPDIQAEVTTTKTVADQPSQSQDWSQVLEQFADLPSRVNKLAGQYRLQLKLMAGLVAAVVLVKLALAMLDAIDGIPLMQPVLELIGLGYVGWFTTQNLLTAERRQELSQTIQTWKVQFLGE